VEATTGHGARHFQQIKGRQVKQGRREEFIKEETKGKLRDLLKKVGGSGRSG